MAPFGKRVPDPADEPDSVKKLRLADRAKLWQEAKRRSEVYRQRAEDLRNELSEAVERWGEPDAKGHINLGLAFTGYNSKGEPEVFYNLQRQRRVQVVLDEDKAAEILERRGLLNECSRSWIQVTDPDTALKALRKAGLLDGKHGVEVISSVDQDLLRDALLDKKLSEEEYRSMIQDRVTWALLALR